MKKLFQILIFIIVCLAAVMGDCAENYRAHYELNVEDDTGKSALSGPSDVILGEPLTFDIGEKSLSLVFSVESSPSNMYSLTVSLSFKEKSKNASSSPPLIQTFHAPFVGGNNGPLEFEIKQNGVKVYGAIALSLIRQ